MVSRAEIKRTLGTGWPLDITVAFDGEVSGYRVGLNFSWSTKKVLRKDLPQDHILGPVGASLVNRLFEEPWVEYLYLAPRAVGIMAHNDRPDEQVVPSLTAALRDVFGSELVVTVPQQVGT